MANEPPCWILDEYFKDTGKRDYSRCTPMCCTTLCELMKPIVMFNGQDYSTLGKPNLVLFRDQLAKLLIEDIGIQKLIQQITQNQPKRKKHGHIT